MQKQYLQVLGRKLPRFMRGSIATVMEVCEISGIQITMVPRLHQSNGYIKRKLQVWKAQKCIALVGVETVLTSAYHGGKYRAENGNMRNFGPTYRHGTAFPQEESLYQRMLRVWRTQKCIALVRGKPPPTCAGLQTTPFHGWLYRAENGNMRNFGPTNSHGTVFAPK